MPFPFLNNVTVRRFKHIMPACLIFGAVLTLVGACVYVTRWAYAPYLYLVGSVLVAVAQIVMRPHSDNFVIRRLYRQQILGALLLVVSAVLMLAMHHNEWLPFLVAAAVFELYTSFRIPQEEAREKSSHQ